MKLTHKETILYDELKLLQAFTHIIFMILGQRMYMMHMLLLPFLPITALIIQVRFFLVSFFFSLHPELNHIERSANVPEGGCHHW